MNRRARTRFRQVIFGYLRGAKASLALAALCTLGVTLTELLKPWPIKIIFDYVLLGKTLPGYLSFLGGLYDSGRTTFLVTMTGAMVIIAVLIGAFTYLQVYVTSRIGNELVYTLRRTLFAHLQRLSLSFHNRTRSGEHMTKIVSDTNTLKDVFAESALTGSSHILTFVGMFAVMFLLDWHLGLVVLATLPLLGGTLIYRYRAAKASSRRQRKREAVIATRISEVMSTVPLVQAFGRERHEQERFEAESSEFLEESIRNARIEAVATRSVVVIGALGTAAVVLVGSLQVLAGRMTPGDLLLFTSYVQSMYKPVRNLARLSNKYSKATVSAERISEILEVEPEIQDAPDAVEASELAGEVVFEDVSFDYGDDESVLKNLSFAVRPGQRVALVGASGAGKSTLVSLILRLYQPQEGSIHIDGANIRDYKLESLRRQIGIVLQDSVLFGATIRENIAYGRLNATDEEIEAAARAANAHEFVVRLEDGYDTVLGERGDTLSGGQRQRIAIARAVIRDARVLILDEPMTGLDVESEARIQEALGRLMVGRTSFLITHDLHAVANADLVLLLEGGRVVEQGHHDELLEKSTRYRRLHDLKTGRRETLHDR
jgi:ABC-type multidrug transport system fused ATPase/permease subunit